MRNRAEKDAVRWCHLTHQVIAGASVHSREHKTSLVRCTDIFFEEIYKPLYNNLRAEKYARHTFYAKTGVSATLLMIIFKPKTAAFHERSGALTRFALHHTQDTR